MSSTKPCDTMVFAPHPYDEALGCAGMIYHQLSEGRKVNVVLLTNGDADGNHWENLGGQKSRQEKMIEHGLVRQKESISAMAVIGLKEEHITFLGYPDNGIEKMLSSENYTHINPYISTFTGLSSTAYDNSYQKNAPYCKASLIGNIEAILNEHQPKDIFITHPQDGHGDHSASGEMINNIVKKMKKPITTYGYYISRAPRVSSQKTSNRLFYKVTGKLKELALDEKTRKMKERCLKMYKTQEYLFDSITDYFFIREYFWRLG
ncbi:MAG: PIG-L family deacetylase [Methanomassiliicoccales archaeon]|nr:MAG: PIG-L family deacetylase [Methanomassiliicoccales archaeon]